MQTAGAAWKTVNQAAANRLDDVEIVVDAPGGKRRLRCASRDPRRVASATWLLDLPPTRDPVDMKVELWVRHRTHGLLLVGLHTLAVKVRS